MRTVYYIRSLNQRLFYQLGLKEEDDGVST